MNRALKLTLVGSLLANVLLVGVLLGTLPPRLGRDRQGLMERSLQGLPEQWQARFRERMQNDKPRWEEVRQARSEAIRILTREPFDEAAYERQVDAVEALRSERTRAMFELFKQAGRELPLEQRKQLAELLNRPPPYR